MSDRGQDDDDNDDDHDDDHGSDDDSDRDSGKTTPSRDSIRTSCGIERSAVFHQVHASSSSLPSSTAPTEAGAYFIAPLNDMHHERSPAYGLNCTKNIPNSKNQNRLFLVGGTFVPHSMSDYAASPDGFRENMLEHLLSIGTLLRGDDLFVDVGKTTRHN